MLKQTILGVGGSPRRGGNSDILLHAVLKGAAAEGSVTAEVQLRDYQFQSCIACERCRKDKECTGLLDGMQLLYPKVLEAAGLVVISPIHNYNMTAIMKAFIDRLYCFYDFDTQRPGGWGSRLASHGRKAVIVVIGEQPDREEGGMDLTMETMRHALTALGYDVVAELPVLGVFHKGRVKEDAHIMEQAVDLGRRLAQQLK
ncbi:iron-sulfur flavoprotein [Dehalogenimonas sp. WBC-2]|nr:iron-sulfur flavoprotein [Dehalogenimonas sp. WBC-2]